MRITSASLVALSSLSLLLTACGETALETMIEQKLEQDGQQNANVDFDMDGSVNVTTDEGTFSTGVEVPADWPSDVPPYPDATVTFAGTSTQSEGGHGGMIHLATEDTAQQVEAYYKDALAAQGWTMEATMNIPGMTMVTATKNERMVGVQILDGEEVTIVLTVGVQ